MASSESRGGADLDTLARVVGRVRGNIERVIEGKPDVVKLALVGAARRGPPADRGRPRRRQDDAEQGAGPQHRLLGAPHPVHPRPAALRRHRRLGLQPGHPEFEFRPGGVFANIVVGDEINRASPKTQSALLECMEERQVTVDNTTYQLDAPFMVIATQNPIEMEGTYALPEAQRDRFMARVSVGYPVEAAEIAMLDSHTGHNPLDDLEPVTDAAEIRKLIGIVGQVYVSEAVQRYAVALTAATRRSAELTLGASPRATAAPGAGRQGVGGDARPRLRAARRRRTPGPAGARPPAAAQRRGGDERPHHRRRSSTSVAVVPVPSAPVSARGGPRA